MTAEPRWLHKAEIIELHDYVILRTGGVPGIRDEGLLESAPARPLNRFAYERIDDLCDLAAAYAVGIAKNHALVDGNKRAAFLALGLFLDLNGMALTASDEDATRTLLGVASGSMNEAQLTAWIRANSAAA